MNRYLRYGYPNLAAIQAGELPELLPPRNVRTGVSMATVFVRVFTLLLLGLVMRAGTATAQGAPARSDSPVVLLFQIGDDLAGDDHSFHRITGMAVGRDGTIFVLDGGNHRVAVYDSEGRHRMNFGREGAGPGEFVRPLAITVDSIVSVFDAAQRRVSRYSRDGAHIDTRRLLSPGDLNLTFARRLRNDSYLGVTTARFSPGGPDHDPAVAIVMYRPDSEAVDTLGSYHSGGTYWHDPSTPMRWGLAPSEFGAGGAWALSGDSLVAIVDGYRGRVTWYGVGTTTVERRGAVDLGVRGRPIAPADLRKVEAELRSRNERAPAGLRMTPPPAWSAAMVALYSDSGVLWVRVRIDGSQQSRRLWYLVSLNGGSRQQVTLPHDFDLLAVRGNLLYGRSYTQFGAHVVRVYRLDLHRP